VSPSPDNQALDPQTSQFLAQLNVGDNTLTAEEREVLKNPPLDLLQDQQVDYFFEQREPPKLKQGNINWLWVPRKKPEETFDSEVKPQLSSLFEEIKREDVDYGDAALYKAKKGATNMYVSLVQLKLGSGTFIVFWSKDPRS
jgi:hypothetical protein